MSRLSSMCSTFEILFSSFAPPIRHRLKAMALVARRSFAESDSLREGLVERQSTAAMLYRPYNLGLLAEALE
jgi:hypothetical protein